MGDITYLRTSEGWLSLAAVIDLHTRMVLGWVISGHMTDDIAVSALAMARGSSYVADGTISHCAYECRFYDAAMVREKAIMRE